MIRIMKKLIYAVVFVLLAMVSSNAQQVPIDGVDARSDPAEFAKGLGSSDPTVRQRSAEALARYNQPRRGAKHRNGTSHR